MTSGVTCLQWASDSTRPMALPTGVGGTPHASARGFLAPPLALLSADSLTRRSTLDPPSTASWRCEYITPASSST
eukprot:CAMPEP_0182907550 /NCGR_PEP_ID=MMETSP0034_2-20130328/34570_1 /TAXON_ID=156128 /ORGANISM="Nephroselmis pyriformis, Strain CCMP717" /LENGTH=74 /DNA_ID=CAMNT_0025043509 /DNA_START=39 /DNA_END=259 /DNA_ORIENTATION=+